MKIATIFESMDGAEIWIGKIDFSWGDRRIPEEAAILALGKGAERLKPPFVDVRSKELSFEGVFDLWMSQEFDSRFPQCLDSL